MEVAKIAKYCERSFEFDAFAKLPHETRNKKKHFVVSVSIQTESLSDAKTAIKEVEAQLNGADLGELFVTTKSYKTPHTTNIARYIAEELSGTMGTIEVSVRLTHDCKTIQYNKLGHQ